MGGGAREGGDLGVEVEVEKALGEKTLGEKTLGEGVEVDGEVVTMTLSDTCIFFFSAFSRP
jgi:hypothetical protein